MPTRPGWKNVGVELPEKWSEGYKSKVNSLRGTGSGKGLGRYLSCAVAELIMWLDRETLYEVAAVYRAMHDIDGERFFAGAPERDGELPPLVEAAIKAAAPEKLSPDEYIELILKGKSLSKKARSRGRGKSGRSG